MKDDFIRKIRRRDFVCANFSCKIRHREFVWTYFICKICRREIKSQDLYRKQYDKDYSRRNCLLRC